MRTFYITYIKFFLFIFASLVKIPFWFTQRKCKLSHNVCVCDCECVCGCVCVCVCLQLSWILQLFGSCIAMCPHLFLAPSICTTNVCGLNLSVSACFFMFVHAYACASLGVFALLLVLIWYFIYCYAIFSFVIVFAITNYNASVNIFCTLKSI